MWKCIFGFTESSWFSSFFTGGILFLVSIYNPREEFALPITLLLTLTLLHTPWKQLERKQQQQITHFAHTQNHMSLANIDKKLSKWPNKLMNGL